jgi:hypothetical protein
MRIFKIFALMLPALIYVPSFGMDLKPARRDDSLKIIEKVYLHTDRSTYYPSENIWFKAYIVDASDNTLSDYSNNLHVELISPDKKIIDNRIARIEWGLAHGDFILSDKLVSGEYILRAYTNYMRNFGDELFFNRVITIVNPSDTLNSEPQTENSLKNKSEISFFPEGGSLVDAVPSIVAFEVSDRYGKAIDVKGEIFTSEGEFVTAFKSTHNGMGIFSLTPISGTRYRAIVYNSKGDTVTGTVPESFPTGIVLNVTGNKNKELLVTVRTNDETLPSLLNQNLTIEVSARSQFYKKADFRMNSRASRFTLPVDDLPDGVFVLTLTSPDKRAVCERLVYIHNNTDVSLRITTDKTLYKQRDSVSLQLSLSDTLGITGRSYLSLSATENIFTDNSAEFPQTISSWFLLQSDVRGAVEEPSYYFDPSNKNRLNDLDLLLLTRGWRDFEWKYKNVMYPPEKGFTISGKVRKTLTDKPLKNALVNIGIFKTGNPIIRLVPTDSSGKFFLDGIYFTGSAKLIASTVDERDRLKGWVLLDSLVYPYPEIPENLFQPKFTENDSQSLQYLSPDSKNQFIQYAEITNSVSRQYKLSDTIRPGEVNIIARRVDAPESGRAKSRRYLMSSPDKEIIITPMEEKYNNTQQLIDYKLLRPVSSNMPIGSGIRMQNPLFMIDGVFVTENELRSLPVSWVERIDVANNQSAIAVFKLSGLQGGPVDNKAANVMAQLGLGDKIRTGPMDGVISIITRNDYNSLGDKVFHSANIRISGYDEPRIFYSPKHHTTLGKDYKPDLRTTLFWEPDIEIGDNRECFVNYYNDDKSGKISVIVEGITSAGIPVTGKAEYEVK